MADTLTPPTTSTIDRNYFKSPTENLIDYNSRITAYNANKNLSTTPTLSGAQPGADVSKAGQPGYDVFGNKVATTSQAPQTTPTGTQGGYSPTDTSQEAQNADPMVVRAQQAAIEQQKYQKQHDDIQNGVIPLSAGDQAQIDNLKQIYDKWISDQQLTNKGATGIANVRGYQSGAAEYDPTFQQKTIGAIAEAGANKIKALQTEQVAKTAELTQALKNVMLTSAKAAYDELNRVQDNLATAIQDHVKGVQKAIKDAQDAKIASDKVIYDQAKDAKDAYYQQTVKPIQDLTQQVRKQGAPDSIAALVAGSKSVEEALNAAGDWLQNATGDLGDYLDFKRQNEILGKTSPGYSDWLDAKKAADSARKVSEAYSTAYASAKGKAAGENAPLPGGVTNLKPLTEVQSKDFTYAQRADQANSIINKLQNSIVGMSSVAYSRQKLLEGFDLMNPFISNDIRQIRQSERNFATAVLRKESGAAISATEFSTVESQYFPRPGDDAITLAQKSQNRDTFINSTKQNVPSYDQRVTTTTAGGILDQAEKIAEDTLTAYVSNHPEKSTEINSHIQTMEKTLGHPINYTDFLQAFPEYK